MIYDPTRIWPFPATDIVIPDDNGRFLYLKVSLDPDVTTAEFVISENHIDPLRDAGYVIYPWGYIHPLIDGQRQISMLWGNAKASSTGNIGDIKIETGRRSNLVSRTVSVTFSSAFASVPVGRKNLHVYRDYEPYSGNHTDETVIIYNLNVTTTGFTFTISDEEDLSGILVEYVFIGTKAVTIVESITQVRNSLINPLLVDDTETVFDLPEPVAASTVIVTSGKLRQTNDVDFTAANVSKSGVLTGQLTFAAPPASDNSHTVDFLPVNGNLLSEVWNEVVPSNQVDGLNTVFYTAQPFVLGSTIVTHGQLRETLDKDYTADNVYVDGVLTGQITFTEAPLQGNSLVFDYIPLTFSGAGQVRNELVTAALVDDVSTVFYTVDPFVLGSTVVTHGKFRETLDIDYTATNELIDDLLTGVITFVNAPLEGNDLVFDYHILI